MVQVIHFPTPKRAIVNPTKRMSEAEAKDLFIKEIMKTVACALIDNNEPLGIIIERQDELLELAINLYPESLDPNDVSQFIQNHKDMWYQQIGDLLIKTA